MLKVRTTKTASGKTAVQVVKRSHQQTHVLHHVGSAQTQQELSRLKKQAHEYIRESLNTPLLFPQELGGAPSTALHEFEQVIERLSFTHTFHTFVNWNGKLCIGIV